MQNPSFITLKTKLLYGVVIFALIAALFPASQLALAQSSAQDAEGEEYLLTLQVPEAAALTIPAGITNLTAGQYASDVTYSIANSIAGQLDWFQQEGKIASYSVDPSVHGIRVWVLDSSVVEQLGTIPQVTGVKPASKASEEASACTMDAPEALRDAVLMASMVSAQSAEQSMQAASEDAQMTTPSISILGSVVSGVAPAYLQVDMTITRPGSAWTISRTTYADSNGKYAFYPHYTSCSGYDYTLLPNDVVTVTSNKVTYATTVVGFNVNLDPATNILSGNYNGGSGSLTVTALLNPVSCGDSTFSKSVIANADKTFTINFSDVADATRLSSATVYIKDGNGNSTAAIIYAYRLFVDMSDNYIGGYLPNYTAYTVSHKRGVTEISSATDSTDYTGYFQVEDNDLQAGDVITVTAGSLSLSYTIVAKISNLSADASGNTVSGYTTANRMVQASNYVSNYFPVRTACSISQTAPCNSTTANAAGFFVVNMASADPQKGDRMEVRSYDSDYNFQSESLRIPVIVTSLSLNSVSGVWKSSNTTVGVVLRASDNSFKDSASYVLQSGETTFNVHFTKRIVAGDKIIVTDTLGNTEEVMTVKSFTARLMVHNGYLAGNGSGSMISIYNDYLPGINDTVTYCQKNTISGDYSLGFTVAHADDRGYGDPDVGMWDYADSYLLGSDGNYTARQSHTFSVSAQYMSDYIYGYTETTAANVTLSLIRDNNTIAKAPIITAEDGFFAHSLGFNKSIQIKYNDRLVVDTNESRSLSWVIPELTVNQDKPNNALYGNAPTKSIVHVMAYDVMKDLTYGPMIVNMGNNSSYATYFNNYQCGPAKIGSLCIQPKVASYGTGGERLYYEGALPDPIGPDSFESDDAAANAKYAFNIGHSFHVATDADWLYFSVTDAALASGAVYQFNANMGVDERINIELYDKDKQTFLAGITADSKSAILTYDFTAHGKTGGVYYLKFTPADIQYAGNCSSWYEPMFTPYWGPDHQNYIPGVYK
jgi:hypothetical protein